MPIIFYGITFLLLLVSLRFKKGDGFLDKESSNIIKGFFILLIVFSHILNSFPYVGFFGTKLWWFRTILGQLCVSMFFFISGYGIVFSIQRDGKKYSRSIITNRFLRLLLYTVVSLIPFFVYSACLGKWHPIEDYFLSFVGLSSFGNASWFIFAILICYLLCAICFFFDYKYQIIPIVIISFGVLAYIIIMYLLGRPAYMWDTIICFSFGMFVCFFKKKINLLLYKNKIIPYLMMLFSIGAVTVLQYFCSRYPSGFPEIIEMWFANFFFCLFFVCLTKVFVLKSPVLSYLGEASYAIYLMHYFVIRCFEDIGTIPSMEINYLILFTTTILVGLPFYYVYNVMDRWIVNPIVKWNRDLIVD